MKILALEFSSPQRSVAVVSVPEDGTGPKGQSPKSEIRDPRSEIQPGFVESSPANLPVLGSTGSLSVSEVIETASGNTMKPLSMVGEALQQAGLEREQIECLAVGIGPGSYTGIRAAISLAQGWQLASRQGGIKLLGISSAECLAAQAQAEGLSGRVSVVIDAQRGELYFAGYELGTDRCRETGPLRLVTWAEARERERAGGVFIGPEVTRWFPSGRIVLPRAATLGRLAARRNDFVAGERLEPIYLRETNFVKAPRPRQIPS